MNTLEIIRMVVYILGSLVGACYLYQVLYLFVPFFKKRKPHGPEKPNRYAVFICARNEENVLPKLLETVNAQDYPAERVRVYVCADNCSDRTAQVAREYGATVFERFDTKNVGKGYALKLLMDKVDPASYDVCLIVDADNLLQPDYIRQINRTFSDGYQAAHGMRNSKNFMQSWVSSGYAIWYMHDCVHLNNSRMRLGVSCAVTGTGFGLTSDLVRRMGGWNFYTLTEDIEFVTWCAINGVKIGYCPEAMLFDEQPARFVPSWRQRVRWMQGGIQISLKYTGRLLRGLRKKGTRYFCFETLTLTMLGYIFSILFAGASMVLTMLGQPFIFCLLLVLGSLCTALLGLFAIGLLTMLMSWKLVPGTRRQKIRATFAFPLFMATYLPVALTAPFMKFEWRPTSHEAVMSLDNIEFENPELRAKIDDRKKAS